MKKIICILSSLIVALSLFSACGNKKQNENNGSEQNSSSDAENNIFDYNSEYKLGDEVRVTVVDSGNEKQRIHIDEYGDYIIMDHCDAQGNVMYYEAPIYEPNGDIKGYNYYDINMNHFACTDSQNRFYNADGVEITENQFTELMNKALGTEKQSVNN